MEIGKQEQLLLGLQGSFLLSKPQKLLLAGSGPPAMVPLPHAVVARVARQLWPEAEPRWLSEDQGAEAELIPIPGIPPGSLTGISPPYPAQGGVRGWRGTRGRWSCRQQDNPHARHGRVPLPRVAEPADRRPWLPCPPPAVLPPFSSQPAPLCSCGAANFPLPAGAGHGAGQERQHRPYLRSSSPCSPSRCRAVGNRCLLPREAQSQAGPCGSCGCPGGTWTGG